MQLHLVFLLVLCQSGKKQMPDVKLTKLPYPYKAALTICSDIDGCSFDDFMLTHQFLNSSQETPLGKGLGLPIGNSFWMYDKPELPNSAFSYLDPVSLKETPYAEKIDLLIQAGILDVMHGYGNFNCDFPYHRKYAEKAIDVLEKKTHRIKVWTNHGGADNLQSIGQNSQGEGDVAESSQYYHADLLRKYGIEFFWDSEMNVSNIIGQDRKSHYLQGYWNNPLYHQMPNKHRQLIKGWFAVWDDILYRFRQCHCFDWAHANYSNELLSFEALRDGQPFHRFKRFGHGRFDWSDDLPLLLNDHVFQRLIQTGGYLILYIHLGDNKNRGKHVLSEEVIHTLRKISDYYSNKEIWIDTTSNLLKYNKFVQNLKWSCCEKESLYTIEIEHQMNISAEDLSGLTFEAPVNKDVQVIYNGRDVYIEVFKTRNGQYAQVPLRSIEWPF